MWFLKRRPKDLESLKGELTRLAQQVAEENFGIKLDFSVESVKDVETILGRLHEDFLRSKSDEGLRGLALEFAAYLVSVIERNFQKGKWTRDHPEIGPDTFPYEWKGGALFPYGWCLNRLAEGPEDNVWDKFQVLVVREAVNGRVDS